MSRARASPFKCSAVISDVDGTLVTDDKRLTPRAQSAVAELHANDPDGSHVGLDGRTVRFPQTIVADFGPALDNTAKIVGVSADLESLAQCERDVQTALAGNASVARSQPYYLDITHPLANKGRALTEVAKLLGVPLAEIAVLGDCSNDVAMFVTDRNSEDGFANAIDRFILGKDRSNARVEVAQAGDCAW
jgi:hydroxymethylpyrimidine pyrophosphatase-like HAD family hydrolase